MEGIFVFFNFIFKSVVATSFATAFFASCSDDVNDSFAPLSEISSDTEEVLSSSEMENYSSEVFSSSPKSNESSSSKFLSSSTASSSSVKIVSSAATVPVSSANETSSSAAAASSSANITQSSSAVSSSATNSNADTSLFEPITRSSSSYSKLRNEPEDERHKIYRLLYPVENGTLDTGYFDQDGCTIQTDGSFICRQRSCIEYVGGYISFHSEGMFPDDGSERHAQYFRGSTDETRLIDINLGDSALTSYIPYADIPEFDIDGIKTKLSTLPAATCTTLVHFESNYKLQASKLPQGLILHHDADYDLQAKIVTEPYSMLFSKEELNTVNDIISDSTKYFGQNYTPFNEMKYAKDPYYAQSSAKYNTYVNDFGCGVMSLTFTPMPAAGYCHGWQIPEQPRVYSFRLINLSDKVPSNITWKLTYMDQFGRGGTIDITTQFQ